MNDPVVLLLTVLVTILSVVLILFLLLLITVLLMIRRSVKKIDTAIDNVERHALIPLLSLRHMFTDVGSFIDSVKAFTSVFTKKKRSSS